MLYNTPNLLPTSSRTPLTADHIQQILHENLEIEFTHNHVVVLSEQIACLSRENQKLLLDWVRRIAPTNIHLAHQFAIRSLPHMYDVANYVVIDEVGKLPFKVANIYRRLTILTRPG